MKKMKKIFAVILSLAMVLGMSATAFAAKVDDTGLKNSITVTNLSEGYETTVKAYNIIYLERDTDGNQNWKIVEWAKNYVDVDSSTGEFTVHSYTDPDTNVETTLQDAVKTQTADQTKTADKDTTSVVFEGLAIGAYVIDAYDDGGTYGLMIANTYDEEAKYMASTPADVVAKLERYNTVKKASDKFVHRGQTVQFTIETQWAPATKGDDTLSSYVIQDKPINLEVTSLDFVQVGTHVLTSDEINGLTITNTKSDDGTTTREYKVDLSSLIDEDYAVAGAKVTVKYSAIVKSDTDYKNEANVTTNTVNYKPGKVEGTEGSFTIKKVDNKTNALKGAKFELYKVGKDEQGKETLTKVSVVGTLGNYKHALDGENGAITEMQVADDGTLIVTGLDEGTYKLQETVAPDGYKLVDTPKEIVITDGNSARVDAGTFVNTKLSSLPSTGGIGTTIFTIAGCAIMIAAAGFFFASRKKANR